MGMEEEFEAIFNLLDPSCRGYIDSEQLQEFHKAFYFTPINADQVEATIHQVILHTQKTKKNNSCKLVGTTMYTILLEGVLALKRGCDL